MWLVMGHTWGPDVACALDWVQRGEQPHSVLPTERHGVCSCQVLWHISTENRLFWGLVRSESTHSCPPFQSKATLDQYFSGTEHYKKGTFNVSIYKSVQQIL